MHTIEIFGKNTTYYMAEHLGECSAVEYINMCHLLFKYNTNQITFSEFKTHAVGYLCGLKKSKKEHKATEEKKLYNIGLLEDLVESFFEEAEELEPGELSNKRIIKQYYIHNPIYKIAGTNIFTKYLGISNEFENVKYGEYVDALGYYADFNDTGNLDYLYLLMATFYREPKPWYKLMGKKYLSDKRKPYHSDRVVYLAKKFRFLDIGIVYGFYLFFASFQKYLPTAKLFVQGVEIDLGILYDNSKFKIIESKAPGLGMESTQYQLAESGIFGDLKKLRATPFWEVYKRLYDIRKRDLDALEQQKQNTDANS